MTTCKTDGCERRAQAQGQCLMHYKHTIRNAARVAKGQADFSIPTWAKECDIGYAAGYIDADGTITLATMKSESTLHGIAFYPHISAVSIDAESVLFLQNLFGGKIMTRPPRSGNLKAFHDIHQWYVGGKRACWISGILAPFLKIKREQAQALSQFYVSSWKQKPPGNNSMPEEEFQRRCALVKSVKYRNQREYLPKIKAAIDAGDEVTVEIAKADQPTGDI